MTCDLVTPAIHKLLLPSLDSSGQQPRILSLCPSDSVKGGSDLCTPGGHPQPGACGPHTSCLLPHLPPAASAHTFQPFFPQHSPRASATLVCFLCFPGDPGKVEAELTQPVHTSCSGVLPPSRSALSSSEDAGQAEKGSAENQVKPLRHEVQRSQDCVSALCSGNHGRIETEHECVCLEHRTLWWVTSS